VWHGNRFLCDACVCVRPIMAVLETLQVQCWPAPSSCAQLSTTLHSLNATCPLVVNPHREQELDAQLRSLQTSELPSKLTPQQLQSLLQCAY
jgi:hypothetical protein